MKLRLPRRRRDRLLAGAAAFAVVAGAGTWSAAGGGDQPTVRRQDHVLDMPSSKTPGRQTPDVGIDISYFTTDGGEKRPAVLLGHGFGGSKDDVREQAERLARDGYAVLTWSARGFGRSGGEIGLNDPEYEVKDVSRLVDWLAARPEVRLDAAGDPRVGVSGASYGGAVSLLAAGYDRRVDAIAPQITYWNLADSLFPQGVFKKLWSGIFFTTGSVSGMQQAGQQPTGQQQAQAGSQREAPAAPGCGRFQPELCAMYERVAVAGKPDPEARALLEQRSPSAVGARIKVPTLIVQGQDDSSSRWTRPTPWPRPSRRTARPSPWTGRTAATTAACARRTGSRLGSRPGSTATSRGTRARTPARCSASRAPAASTPPTARCSCAVRAASSTPG